MKKNGPVQPEDNRKNVRSKTKLELSEELSYLKKRVATLTNAERKNRQARKTLLQNEELLRSLFERSGYAALLIENGKFIDCNEAALKIIGCLHRSQIIGLTPEDLSPHKQPDGEWSAKKTARMLSTAYSKGSSTFEWLHNKSNGTEVHLDVVLTPIKIKNRDIIYTTWRDITAQKRMEDALKKSEQRLADIIDFLPDATFVTDVNGEIITWNRAIEEMTQVGKKDMLGKKDHAAMIPFYGKRKKHLLDLIDVSNEEIEFNYQYIRRKGNIVYGEAFAPLLNCGEGAYLWGTAAPLYDPRGNRVGAIESIRDITESKLAEKALKKSEERFRILVDYAPLGISLINQNGEFGYINPRFTEIFGYTLEDMPNKQTWFYSIRTDGKENFGKGRLKTDTYEQTLNIVCKDKKEKIITTHTKILDDGRQLIFYKDITEQRAMETQLRQANKIEAIGTLAAGIAHDFNNILGGMIGYTEMSLLHVDKNNYTLKQYLEQIRNGIQRAANLVKQILTFGRQTNQEIRPVKVIPLIKETLKLIRAAIPTSIEINYSVETDRDLILADPTLIYQILMNLCANAAQAMQEQGGILKIQITDFYFHENNDIAIDIQEGPYLKITVSDTGPGIDKAIIDRIFDPFFTTKKPGEGTGLGLAVVHGIVKSLEGAITTRNIHGHGAEFGIYLPLLEEENGGIDLDMESTYTGGKERILFVDDEENITRIAREMLAKMGYEVTATTSSANALEIFRLNPGSFDVIISDQTMPGMTGAVMASEILKIRPDIPLIISTGFNGITNNTLLKSIGINEFIMKPFTMATLDHTIRKIIAQGK